MQTLYEKKIEAIEEAGKAHLPVPAAGTIVEHTCSCGQVTRCRLTGVDEVLRRIEWEALTSPHSGLKCEVCGNAAAAREAAYWAAMRESHAGKVETSKLTPLEQKIEKAGFPLAMTKFDPAKAKPVGIELHHWVHDRREENLWIADYNDVGKTHAVCAVGAAIVDLDINVKYFSGLKMQLEYVATRQTDNYSSLKFIESCRCRLLIIDDVGQGGMITGTAGEIYYEALKNQINDGNLFWIVANIDVPAFGAMFAEWNTGEGVTSRIRRAVKQDGIWSERNKPG